jgi:hypothetical protein
VVQGLRGLLAAARALRRPAAVLLIKALPQELTSQETIGPALRKKLEAHGEARELGVLHDIISGLLEAA